jgi:hypothetical protein
MSDSDVPQNPNPSPATEGSAADGNFVDGDLPDFDALPNDGAVTGANTAEGGANGEVDAADPADPAHQIDITQSDGPNLQDDA